MGTAPRTKFARRPAPHPLFAARWRLCYRLRFPSGRAIDMSDTSKARTTVTVADVAALAGVHPSTVSRALNEGTQRVSAELVERVFAASKELGYRPNGIARALRMERSLSVGMIIPDISNPIYAPIVRGVEDVLRNAGRSVFVASTDNDLAREADSLTVMLDRKVDGILLATATRDYPHVERLQRANTPVVLINRATSTPWAPLVKVDDHKGVSLAVEHLQALGHTQIAHLAGTATVSSGYDRRHAFVRSMQEAGLPVDPTLIVSADIFGSPVGLKLGNLQARELLSRCVTFTAVIAANDLLAVGCYDVFAEAGIRVPEDVSIVGYHDMPLVNRLSPPLTTVRSPQYQLGAQAGTTILQEIASRSHEGTVLSLAPRLIVRGSTAAPRSEL
ncbi:LacI family DNA-binding transcriptional regulator [Faunimonas sp. B44]|uniref:LacI family DNA-binding transcriptional regulator n=1 Tax=Faunimonas sp. B44 TaxID=3461493 RepID=UPI004044E406